MDQHVHDGTLEKEVWVTGLESRIRDWCGELLLRARVSSLRQPLQPPQPLVALVVWPRFSTLLSAARLPASTGPLGLSLAPCLLPLLPAFAGLAIGSEEALTMPELLPVSARLLPFVLA